MDMAFTARPFAFDRIFAAGEPPPTGREARDPISLAIEVEALHAELIALRAHQQDELAHARRDAFQAGLDQARSDRDTAILAAIDALHAGLDGIEGSLTQIQSDTERDATDVALAAARQIAGHALYALPVQAVDDAIGRVLGQVTRGTDLLVSVHPDLAPDVEAQIAARQAGDRRRLNLQVRADAALAIGDARIEWDAGSLTLDRAAREARVAAEIAAALDIDSPGKNFPPAEPAA